VYLAEATGIPLFQKETTGSGFEQEVKAAIGSLIPEGIEGVICGDIYLEKNRTLMERICGDLGIELVEPLWGKVPEKSIPNPPVIRLRKYKEEQEPLHGLLLFFSLY